MSLKIKMYGRLNKPDQAMASLYRIQELGLIPGILTLNSVIDSVARTGGHAYFQEILTLIRQYDLTPNGCTYSIIAKGYASGGLLNKAMDTFRMMLRNGFSADPVTYNSLLDGCSKEGKVDLAEQLLAEMRSRGVGPNAITYSILVKLYCNHDLSKAFAILDELKANQQNQNQSSNPLRVESSNPLRVAYSSFIHALSSTGDIVRGRDVLLRMLGEGFRPDGFHYSSLASSAAQQGKLSAALEFIEMASNERCVLSAKTFSNISRIAEKKRDFRVKERLRTLQQEGVFMTRAG